MAAKAFRLAAIVVFVTIPDGERFSVAVNLVG
jgi:hypothetical protein